MFNELITRLYAVSQCPITEEILIVQSINLCESRWQGDRQSPHPKKEKVNFQLCYN